MTEAAAPSCPGCKRLQEQVDALRAQIEALQASLAQLQQQLAQARKNSSTSSKPPSSDIVKPPKAPPQAQQTARAIGGQPGHPKHQRPLFPPEQVQAVFDYRPGCCPDCGHELRPTGFGPHVVQQVDLPEVPLRIEEHRRHEGYCPHCAKVHHGRLPGPVQHGGLLGPREWECAYSSAWRT